MVKKRKRAAGAASTNEPLQTFLIALAVNEDDLQNRYEHGSDDEKRSILANEFKIGNGTIAALLSGKSGAVKARLRFSDQQGFKTAALKRRTSSK